MRKTSGRPWASRRRGVTLVEALAGAAILGTLLVCILVANARLTAQDRRSAERIEACRIADGLLGRWWSGGRRLARDAAGDVPGSAGWRWRMGVVTDEDAEVMDARIVRLEVFAPDTEGGTPAVGVELLLANEEDEDKVENGEDERAEGTDAG